MALRGSGDVDDVRIGFCEHFIGVRETIWNAKSFAKLPRHKHFLIAERHDRSVRNPLDRMHMLIRNFATADYADTKHFTRAFLRIAAGTCAWLPACQREISTQVVL